MHSGATPVTSMPYGVAMSCVSQGNASGVGNIDLTGTPFKVASSFSLGGSQPAGTATLSSGNQVVSLTGGGFCGWNAETTSPPLFNPFNPVVNGDVQVRILLTSSSDPIKAHR